MFDLDLLQQLISLIDENALEKIHMILLLVSLVLALMQCYFGYRFLRFWIGVLGFLIGSALGFSVSLRFFEIRTWYPWAIGLAGGILLALLSYKLYLIGVFIFSGCIAAAAVYAVLELPAVSEWLAGLHGELLHKIIVAVLCAAALVLFGTLSVRFSKPIIIVVTSLSGALLASRTLLELMPSLAEKDSTQFLIAAALGVTGVLLQHLMNLGKK